MLIPLQDRLYVLKSGKTQKIKHPWMWPGIRFTPSVTEILRLELFQESFKISIINGKEKWRLSLPSKWRINLFFLYPSIFILTNQSVTVWLRIWRSFVSHRQHFYLFFLEECRLTGQCESARWGLLIADAASLTASLTLYLSEPSETRSEHVSICPPLGPLTGSSSEAAGVCLSYSRIHLAPLNQCSWVQTPWRMARW